MVIATDCWIQYASDSNHEKKMHARGSLICHTNSYPFIERNLLFEKPIKIGRSVARAKASTTNAIFDCKVLSRNHALLWYDSGKFFLKDTKSSNGTFINNKRLSASGEESAAREVCSGDIVQFGVDVVENNSKTKVTHGCIVATLKLYLPNGKAKASLSNSDTYVNVTFEDLYKLNQFIQEAGRREIALRTKLGCMQILLEQTKVAAVQSWKALVLEDCLLSRLEILESQVIAYSKNFEDDKLRIELVNLLENKAIYENATKELLQKKVQEINKSIGKTQILKCRLNETEEETLSLHNIIKANQNELLELTIKYRKIQQKLRNTTDKLYKTKSELKEVLEQSEKDKQDFLRSLEDQKNIQRDLKSSIKDLTSNKINIQTQITALKNYMQIVQNIKNDKSSSFERDFLNPANIIDNILSKWNYMFLDVVNYEVLLDKFEQDQLNSIEKHLKSHESFCINNDLTKNVQYISVTTSESDQYKYILPPTSKNILIKTKSMLESKEIVNKFKNEFFLTDIENSIIFDCDNEFKLEQINKNVSVSEIDNISYYENDNISTIKLILRFSSKNDYNLGHKVLKKNFAPETNYFNNLLGNSFTKQIIKVTKKTNNIIEIKNKFLAKQKKLKHQQVYFYILKLLITSNVTFNKYSQDFILKEIIHLLHVLRTNYNNTNYHIVIQELQDLRNWLSCESNVFIFDKLMKYQIRNENKQVQELSEQLVILKEKYNSSIDEKACIIKKYISLKTKCKDFINTTYMVPIYYVVPIIFALICMILEKIL